MTTRSSSSIQLFEALAVLVLAGLLLGPALLAGQDRNRVNTRAARDSFAYRVATFSPSSGPPGTAVAVKWQFLPAVTPVRLAVGAQRVGFEVLKDILTDLTGEFTDTVVVPSWAKSDRPHALVVLDFYFHTLAVSDGFQVTEPDGSLSRDGRLVTGSGPCARLVALDGEVYQLSGDLGQAKVGDRVIVRGTLAEPSLCGEGKEVTIRVTHTRMPFGPA